MPPFVASVLCIGFMTYLFRRDFRRGTSVTGALWVPFLWVFISGSRFISAWLAIIGIHVGAISEEEGSPVDAVFFALVIVAGIFVLHRRRVNLAEFARQNRWVTIYLLYCLVAISWSDFPFVAFKRWIKLFGQPVMVLVIFTEPDPMEALKMLFKWCSYVWLPVSILFIKYYPQWGLGFDQWDGLPSNLGITLNKNALGCDCLVLGLFYLWYFMQVWRTKKDRARQQELYFCLVFFYLTGWVMHAAHSSTSLGALIMAAAIMIFVSARFVDRRMIGSYITITLMILGLSEALFGIHKLVIAALGRNDTLTGRTEIWQILLHWKINPMLGAGFESFWLGPRVDEIGKFVPGLPLNEAHNGYLETYLNLGFVGLAITIIMLLSTYFKIQRVLLWNFEFGRFRLAYLGAFLVYNWTEAAFRTHAVPFFMFFLIAIDYQARSLQTQSESAPTATEEGFTLGLAESRPSG